MKKKNKMKIKSIATIISLLLISILAITVYYSYSDGKLMNGLSSEDRGSKADETRNFSIEQKNPIQGKVITVLKNEFRNKFFIFSLIILSFLAAIFLINFFRKKAEENPLMFKADELRNKMKAEKTSNHAESQNITLFGESRNFMLLLSTLLIILSLFILNFIFLRSVQDISSNRISSITGSKDINLLKKQI